MRQIELNPREARMLRDTLSSVAEGYDALELEKLAWMSKKLTLLMGEEYTSKIAEAASEERRIRRSQARGQITRDAREEALLTIRYDVDELNEVAGKQPAQPWFLEEADYKLVKDKLGSVKWLGLEDARDVVLSLLKALKDPPQVEPAALVPATGPEVAPEPNTHKRKMSLVEA